MPWHDPDSVPVACRQLACRASCEHVLAVLASVAVERFYRWAPLGRQRCTTVHGGAPYVVPTLAI